MLASRGTIDRWLEHAASFVGTNPEASTAHFSTQLRESIAAAARDILDVAARAVGSHPSRPPRIWIAPGETSSSFSSSTDSNRLSPGLARGPSKRRART